jgi:hypothetical protein
VGLVIWWSWETSILTVSYGFYKCGFLFAPDFTPEKLKPILWLWVVIVIVERL